MPEVDTTEVAKELRVRSASTSIHIELAEQKFKKPGSWGLGGEGETSAIHGYLI